MPLFQLFIDNITFFLPTFVGSFIALFVAHYIFSFYKYEVLKMVNQKLTMQDDMGKILYNLDQSIISFSDNGISYLNKIASQMLNKILKSLKINQTL